MSDAKSITIVLADDDPDDRLLAREALEESRLANTLITVEDGAELLDYLLCQGAYENRPGGNPGLVLLDLNMPRMDGREALAAIKAHENLRTIPVVVLTTSKAEEDILRTYDLGVNSFITKPVSFDELVTVMRDLGRYWLEIVELPSPLS